MEDLIAIPISEYEWLKASEDELIRLMQKQIDDIRRIQHEKMMESIVCSHTLCQCNVEALKSQEMNMFHDS